MNVNLLVHCPHLGDATSFYRGMGPLSHLSKTLREEGNRLNLQFTSKFAWETIAPCDVVFQQRPFTKDHLTIAQISKELGKPLWVDFDDDLFNVPTDNPTHEQYGKPNVQKNIAEIIAMADIVTVSTEHLRKRFEPLNSEIRVVPNAINEHILYYRETKDIMRNRLILWRGSATHQKDLATFSPQIIAAAKKMPKWTWTFLGYNPWFISDHIEKSLVAPALDIIEFHKFLHEAKPALTVVPLHNNIFNLSKSNIAWMETIWAGGLALAPNWEEWQKPGCLLYENVDSFQEELEWFVEEMESPDNRAKFANENEEAWQWIRSNLTLASVNRARRNIIEELAAFKPTNMRSYEAAKI